MSILDGICRVIEVAGPAFSRGFVEAVAEQPERATGNRISTSRAAIDAGTPVADSMEELAGVMFECAQSIRPREPLDVATMRDYGRAVMLANGEAVRVMGALMGRLGQ
jgi:hypothetical protein